jgi:ribosomal protein S18 acetylase RimI-like enzyme
MCSVQLLISTAEGEYSAVIEDVVVNKNHHEEGIGKKLIGSAEKWAMEKGATRVTLLADKDNSNALGFYDRLNFKRTNMICLKKHITKL